MATTKSHGQAYGSPKDCKGVERRWLDEKVFKAIQVSLLSFNDQNALQRLKRDGFVAGSDSDYKLTRMTIENNRQFFE